MKKYFSFSVIIVVLLIFPAITAQAVQSLEDTRIAKSAPAYTPQSYQYQPYSYADAAKIAELQKQVDILKAQVSGKKGLINRMGDAEKGIKKAQETGDRVEKKVNALQKYVDYLCRYLKYFSVEYNKSVDAINATTKVANETAKSALTTTVAIVVAIGMLFAFAAVVFGIISFFERRRNKTSAA